MFGKNVRTALKTHLQRTWPDVSTQEFVWTLGPAQRELPALRVIRIGPSPSGAPWIYATVGAWEASEQPDGGTEFFLLSPEETARHVETLFMVSYFQKTQAHKLGPGSTVNLGHGWLDQPSLERMLVSLPYPLGPDFEWARLSDTLKIRYLWLMPVTSDEVAFVKQYGLEALEQGLEKAQIDILAPLRPSVV
jgi:hypothetical protein